MGLTSVGDPKQHHKHRNRFPGSVVTISKYRNIFNESNLIRIFLT